MNFPPPLGFAVPTVSRRGAGSSLLAASLLVVVAGCRGEPTDPPADAAALAEARPSAAAVPRRAPLPNRGATAGGAARVSGSPSATTGAVAAPPAGGGGPVAERLIDFPGLDEGLSDAEIKASQAAGDQTYMTTEAFTWLLLGEADRALVRSAQAGGGGPAAVARRIADGAADPWLREYALTELAERAAAAGDHAAADAAAETRLAEAKTDVKRVRAGVDHAKILTARGDRDRAIALLKSLPLSRPTPVPAGQGSPELNGLHAVALGLAKAGAPADATQIYLSLVPREADRELKREYLRSSGGPLADALYRVDPAVAARFQLQALRKFPGAVTALDVKSVVVKADYYGGPAEYGAAAESLLLDRFPNSSGAADVAFERAEAAREAGDAETAERLYKSVWQNRAANSVKRQDAGDALAEMGAFPEPTAPRPLTPVPDPAFRPDGGADGGADD